MSHPVLAGPPAGPVAVPDAIARLAGDDVVTPVWRNVLGGLTFRMEARSGGLGNTSDPPDLKGTRYVKWVVSGTPEIDLDAEAERLTWAQQWVTVPTVLERGTNSDGAWLVTAAVPGRPATDPRWGADPVTAAAAAIGHGLRLLHDRLPVDLCPFSWSVGQRLAGADERIANGDGPADWFPEHRHLDVAQARARLGEPPACEHPVVCHGDACAPNTLVHDDGTFSAHVDLGSLGVADRWADLAVAAWSTEWNYGPGYDRVLYDGYGVVPDPERIAYYRLLWDLG